MISCPLAFFSALLCRYKVVRLLRVVLMMTRLQRSRDQCAARAALAASLPPFAAASAALVAATAIAIASVPLCTTLTSATLTSATITSTSTSLTTDHAATTRYRMKKFAGIGAPVERVFEMITELRGKVDHLP